MRIFISAGEPSGDLHGSNLALALRRARPDVECVGFGGDRMEAAGCRLLYPLCRHAITGWARALAEAAAFLRLLRQADAYFRERRPDAVVLIDYPGFHWWLARRAKAHGIPVYYFVPPQLWAWAGWRVKKVRRFVDHVLCSLPFEPAWYRDRGVTAHYLGHPYFDELPQQQLNAAFVEAEQDRPGTVIGLLPGSRNQELESNLTTLLGAARIIHTEHPETRFLVACYKDEHRRQVEGRVRGTGVPVEAHAGRTAEIIHLSKATVAVSGSVGLELLYRGKPSVVVYRAHPVPLFLSQFLRTCRYISLVNLLAGRELFPEFLTHRDEAEKVAARVLHWLNDEGAYHEVCEALAVLKGRVAVAGACRQAAGYILDTLARQAKQPLAA
ncbi:MAG TPA: lipid-A-disaccharide synthase [Gemmataceae bacterium]|nr:lipid-A-disaccharide synthase [Gemmataceae bacterium]